jgi:hypothetical protein
LRGVVIGRHRCLPGPESPDLHLTRAQSYRTNQQMRAMCARAPITRLRAQNSRFRRVLRTIREWL